MPQRADTPPAEIVARESRIRAVAFSSDGETLYFAVGSDRCVVNAVDVATRETKTSIDLSFCPERLTTFSDGAFLASSAPASSSEWIGSDGSVLFEGRTILAAMDASHLLEKTQGGLVWVDGETSVQLEPSALRSPRIATGGSLLAVETLAEGERVVRFDGASLSAITPVFELIDSWDVAPGGGEVVFSAMVGAGYDVGIVSVSGGDVRWVAPDPADEKNVTWAPRGSKITYTFESLDATLVRSVHVPTSYQVIFDLPLTSVRSIAWEPMAERFAMVTESPDAGDRIEWIGYQGDARATLVEAFERVDSPVEALFWEGGSGVLLGPETVRYGQARATVVWIESEGQFSWHADVGRLRKQGLPVLVILSPRIGGFRDVLAELPWVSASRLYVVDVSGEAGAEGEKLEAATWIARAGRSAPEGATFVAGEIGVFRALSTRRILELEEAGH